MKYARIAHKTKARQYSSSMLARMKNKNGKKKTSRLEDEVKRG